MKLAIYYQSKFAAGLLYVGRAGGEEQWLGSQEQWALAERLEHPSPYVKVIHPDCECL